MKGLPRSLAKGPAASAPIRKLALPVTALALTVANGSSAPGIGSVVIGDLPEGNLLFLGAIAYLQFNATGDTDAAATWNGDFAVGTAPNADADLTDATDYDLIDSTAVGPAVARVSPVTRGTKTGVAILDNTDGSLEVNLNVMVDDADQTAAISMTVTGVVIISLIVLGDD